LEQIATNICFDRPALRRRCPAHHVAILHSADAATPIGDLLSTHRIVSIDRAVPASRTWSLSP